MKIILLWHDQDAESPTEYDGAWKLYSFSRRHKAFKHPDHFFEDGALNAELQRKLDSGLAFLLSYYEHGLCVWSLKGTGPQCPWDSVDVAGILVWEHAEDEMGATTVEARTKDAASFLESYTAWCNGQVYGFTIEDERTLPCGHTERVDLESCGGYYGNDLKCMAEAIREGLNGDKDYRFEGEAKYLGDSLSLA